MVSGPDAARGLDGDAVHPISWLTDHLAWPFPLRPSLAALADPDLRREAATGLVLWGAAAFAATGLSWRRSRWPALLLAALLGVIGYGHVDFLLVPAYPTSFRASPTGFAAAGIVGGADLYRTHCAGCHGREGRGDGPAASGLPVPPADLAADHLWDHPDGDLFWWVAHGIDDPDGGPQRMPGAGGSLPDALIWALIDYVRANNAGLALRATGRLAQPLQAPPLRIRCPDGRTLSGDDLRGRVVRLIVPGPGPVDPAPDALVQDVVLTGAEAPGRCAATEPDLPAALAILIGEPAGLPPGTEVLIDPEGRLRSRSRPGEPSGWAEAGGLLAEVDRICRPLPRPAGAPPG